MPKRIFKIEPAKVLGEGIHIRLSPIERNVLLEIAYLIANADGLFSPDEIDAFAEAMRVIFDPNSTHNDIRTQLEQYAQAYSAEGLERRLTALAPQVTFPYAKEQAYKLAYSMTLSDYESHQEENRVLELLRHGLGFTDEEAESLEEQVIETITPSER